MPLHQPFVHDLCGVFTAPVHAWSTPSGAMTGEGAEGLFLADDRLLKTYAVAVRGMQLPGGAAAPADLPAGELSSVGLETFGATKLRFTDVVSLEGLPVDPVVRLVREREAHIDGVHETLTVTSAADHPVAIELDVTLGLDASPMAAVKDPHLAEKLAVPAPTASLQGNSAQWSWREGTHANLMVEGEATALTASTDGAQVLHVRLHTTLEPNTSATVAWDLTARDDRAPFTGVDAPALGAGLALEQPSDAEQAAVGTLLSQSLADLTSLRLVRRNAPEQEFLAAGAPWFFTLFGRDSLIAASFLAPLHPELAASTLRTLATQQGSTTSIDTAEQPGKILHEVRAVGMDMGDSYLPPVYYGTIDATPLWILLAGDVTDLGLDVSDLADNVARAADWLLDHADADGDLFLEYIDESGHGLANQGWKDSGDSVRFADGTIAEGPIALAEVQGYAYEAGLVAAQLLEEWGHERAGELGKRLRERSDGLRRAFRDQFWVEDSKGAYVALALDGKKRSVDGVASNMGHLLGTGLLDEREERLVIDRLMDSTMFTGFGIRTLSSDNGAYFPTRYHGGSVWSHDTAFIMRQAMRAGFTSEAQQIARALVRAAQGFDWRLPELFAGDPTVAVQEPLPYPASCRPQAWAAASAVPIAEALGVLPSRS